MTICDSSALDQPAWWDVIAVVLVLTYLVAGCWWDTAILRRGPGRGTVVSVWAVGGGSVAAPESVARQAPEG